MKDQDKKQIIALIQTFEEQRQYVPFVQDFLKHPTYGPLFNSFSSEELVQVDTLIHNYIEEKIDGLRTKGGQYFQRFFETMNDDFRKFRQLNSDIAHAQSDEFQKLGGAIEKELFRYEGLLTEAMLKRPEALDKVVGAFYNIIYKYFPLYNSIDSE